MEFQNSCSTYNSRLRRDIRSVTFSNNPPFRNMDFTSYLCHLMERFEIYFSSINLKYIHTLYNLPITIINYYLSILYFSFHQIPLIKTLWVKSSSHFNHFDVIPNFFWQLTLDFLVLKDDIHFNFV